MAKKDGRFVIHQEKVGFEKVATIVLDRRTGVQYLYYQEGYGGGLTPLLDRDGKPFVQQVDDEQI